MTPTSLSPAVRDTLTRAFWTFVQAAAAVLLLDATNVLNPALWKTATVAGLAAVLSLVKNGLLLVSAAPTSPPLPDTITTAEQDLSGAPQPPTGLRVRYLVNTTSGSPAVEHLLGWKPSENATGYRVYYDGSQVFDTKVRSYDIPEGAHNAALYSVSAYNAAGESERAVVES